MLEGWLMRLPGAEGHLIFSGNGTPLSEFTLDWTLGILQRREVGLDINF